MAITLMEQGYDTGVKSKSMSLSNGASSCTFTRNTVKVWDVGDITFVYFEIEFTLVSPSSSAVRFTVSGRDFKTIGGFPITYCDNTVFNGAVLRTSDEGEFAFMKNGSIIKGTDIGTTKTVLYGSFIAVV